MKILFNVKEQGGDFVAKAWEGQDVVLQNKSGVRCGFPSEGTTLEGVDKGEGQCLCREA